MSFWPHRLITVITTHLDLIYNNWFRVTFQNNHGRRVCGPDMRCFRKGIRTFAPDGFISRVDSVSNGRHPHHDQRYIGSFPRQLLDSQGIPIQGRYLHNQLSSTIKSQFEPILEHELQPVPSFVQNMANYLGKSTGMLIFVSKSKPNYPISDKFFL